jgi:hypothetical protein
MLKEQANYNRGGMIAFTFSMIFTMCFIIYISFFYRGIQIDEIKGQAGETAPATEAAPAPAAPAK